MLVGHSAGGYAVTAGAAGGLVEPAALCVVDGVVLDDRDASLAEHADADLRTAEPGDRLRTMFRYGWQADDEQMHAHVEQCVREAGGDWLNAGARPGPVEEDTRRSFTRRGQRWVRRPTTEVWTHPRAHPHPHPHPS